jgi:MFS family permease
MGSLRERISESLGALRGVYANPSLRRMQLAFAGAVFGSYAYGISVAVYAYEHGGATAVGLVAFVRLISAAAVAPFAALLADRLRRERVMLASDLARAVLVAGAGLAAVLGSPALVVYALAVLATLAGTPFHPAEASLAPALARTPEELTAVNVSSSSFDSLGSFLGPAVAGLMLAVTGPGVVFFVMAACFLWSASFLVRIRGPEREPVAGGGHGGGLREAFAGFRAIGAEPRLRLLIFLYAAQAMVAGALGVLVVVTALDLLKIGNSGVGFLESASGIGSLVGAGIALALVARRKLAGDFGLGIVLWGAPLVLLGLFPNTPIALVALGVLGVGNTLVDIAAMTLLQRTAPEEVAGRVFGVLDSMLVGALGLGSVLAPALIALLGARAALVIVGSMLPVLAALRWRQLQEIDEGAQVPQERIDALRRIPIFAPLPLRTVELVATRLDRVELAAGADLFRRGDEGDRFYVVADGELEVVLDEGAKVEGPGSYVGEIALLRNVPRTATVRARTDVRLWALDRHDFLSAVTGHARSREAANQVVGARLGYAPSA